MTDRTAPADRANNQLAELEARYAALRQAARSPGAQPVDVLVDATPKSAEVVSPKRTSLPSVLPTVE